MISVQGVGSLAEMSLAQLQTSGRNLILLREAELVAASLEDRGISATFLKGVALLDAMYESLADRRMVDIDVLVRAKDLEKAVAVLRESGYAAQPNALVLSKSAGEILIQVDLHAELWLFHSEDFWRRRERKSKESRMKVLCPVDQFLHIAWHSVVQDGHVSVQALSDCHAILESNGSRFSWDRLAAIAVEEGWEKPVTLFLEQMEATYPGIIPAEVLDVLSRRKFSRQVGARGRVPSNLDSTGRAAGCSYPRRSMSRPFDSGSLRWQNPYVRMLKLQSQWRKRIRLILKLALPSPGFLRMRYSRFPRSLSFLLTIFRPILLSCEFVAGQAMRCRPGRYR